MKISAGLLFDQNTAFKLPPCFSVLLTSMVFPFWDTKSAPNFRKSQFKSKCRFKALATAYSVITPLTDNCNPFCRVSCLRSCPIWLVTAWRYFPTWVHISTSLLVRYKRIIFLGSLQGSCQSYPRRKNRGIFLYGIEAKHKQHNGKFDCQSKHKHKPAPCCARKHPANKFI